MTLRVVPSSEVLTEAHLLNGELWFAPYCAVPWWPALDSDLARQMESRLPPPWWYRRLKNGGAVPEPERYTRCGLSVTNDPPWLEWPADDPLRTCRRCQSAESRDDTPGGEVAEATLL